MRVYRKGSCNNAKYAKIKVNSVHMSPVGWSGRIHRLRSVLIITLKNLMVRLLSWNFGKCGLSLHCHCSQVHSDLK